MVFEHLGFSDWQALTPAEAVSAVMRRVERLTPQQRRAIFATVCSDENLHVQFTTANRSGPLGGVPYALKDLFDVAGQPTLAGSTFLPEVRPASGRDCALVKTMHSAGAVLAGKTHLYEFAFGLTGENPHYGDCTHPQFPEHGSGGSSSGSAAAVAAGIVPLAIGTDTGGSIRVPSAFCGLFGFRMTPHHPWIADAFPLAPSYDTAGWFTRTANDMLAVMNALLGASATSVQSRGCWLEMPGMDAEIAQAFRKEAEKIVPEIGTAMGADLRKSFADAAEIYGVLGAREAWTIHQKWVDRFSSRYDPVVLARLEKARALTTEQIENAEVKCTALIRSWERFFQVYDFLVLPASPCVALTKAECTPASRSRLLALTAPVSLAGYPVLVLPIVLASGLSTGLQIVVKDTGSPGLREILSAFSPR